jgi:hypothetical protein
MSGISVRIIEWGPTAKYFSEPDEFIDYLKKKDGRPKISLLAVESSGTNLTKMQKIIDTMYSHNEWFQNLEIMYVNCMLLRHKLVIDFGRICLPGLKKLTSIDVGVVGLEKISAQITDVSLIHPRMDEFPRIFHNELSSLKIHKNTNALNINDLSMYKNLRHITISSSNLSTLPILPNTGQLKHLDVSYNHITEITNLPDCINILYINNNYITSLDAFPVNVSWINMSQNPLRRFPENLVLCRSLNYIYLHETEIEMTAMEMRFLAQRTNYRPVDRMMQRDITSVYENRQNIHATSIQKSFLKSCQNLLLDKIPDQVFTGTGNRYVDENIRQFSQNRERHCILYITFSELFQKVWNRIATQRCDETRFELLKRLREEMIEAEAKCFMGQITRLLNVLVGFYDDICIEIDDSEQIYAKIQANRNRNNKVVNLDELVDELREIRISEDKIREWVDAVRTSL